MWQSQWERIWSYQPHDFFYKGSDQDSMIMSSMIIRRLWCVFVTSCCPVMFGGVHFIIMALVVQSTMQLSSGHKHTNQFRNKMSAIVRDGIGRKKLLPGTSSKLCKLLSMSTIVATVWEWTHRFYSRGAIQHASSDTIGNVGHWLNRHNQYLGPLVQLTDWRVAKHALTSFIPSQELPYLIKLSIDWSHMNQLECNIPQAICMIVGEEYLEYLKHADFLPQGNPPANPCDCCTGSWCDRWTEICRYL